MAQHRHAGLGLDAGDEAFSAARDQQVDGAVQPGQQGADGGPVGGGHQLDGVGGQAGRGQALDHGRMDRQGAGETIGAAAQEGDIARAQTEGGGVGGDVGTALIDDGQHAQRGADAGEVEAVGPGPARGLDPERIGEGGDLVDRLGHGGDPGGGQGQPVDEGLVQPIGPGPVDVAGVGGEDGVGPGADGVGDGGQGGGAGLAVDQGEGSGGGAGAAAHVGHQGGDVGRGHAGSSTRSSRWMATPGPL